MFIYVFVHRRKLIFIGILLGAAMMVAPIMSNKKNMMTRMIMMMMIMMMMIPFPSGFYPIFLFSRSL